MTRHKTFNMSHPRSDYYYLEIMEREFDNQNPVVSNQTGHPLQQQQVPPASIPQVAESSFQTLHPLQQQPGGTSPLTSALRHQDFQGLNYSVTKVNTQNVPFVFLITPDFDQQQPKVLRNEKVKIPSPSSTSMASAIARLMTPVLKPKKTHRKRQPEVEIEMTTFPSIPQDYLNLDLGQ